jgi:lysylphosphatidylglycerol synthetase-like protein (DUF2156 family)
VAGSRSSCRAMRRSARAWIVPWSHGKQMTRSSRIAFKQKFDPEWTPKYLAYPGGLRLPGILADLAALVAGGYRRILASPPALLKRP